MEIWPSQNVPTLPSSVHPAIYSMARKHQEEGVEFLTRSAYVTQITTNFPLTSMPDLRNWVGRGSRVRTPSQMISHIQSQYAVYTMLIYCRITWNFSVFITRAQLLSWQNTVCQCSMFTWLLEFLNEYLVCFIEESRRQNGTPTASSHPKRNETLKILV